MNIAPSVLVSQCQRFLASWPQLWAWETAARLPRGLLLAVGSRETNLTNETGDDGHGHGVWQLDDRSHTIPAGFDVNVGQQASTAAGMLRALLDRTGGNVDQAACYYNSGQPDDRWTTGGDYGSDVASRLAYIQAAFTPPHPSEAVTAVATRWAPAPPVCDWLDHPGGGVWLLTPEGAIYTTQGAPYLGGANGQSYFAGRTAARLYPDPESPGGYMIVDTAGECYRYPAPAPT